MKKFSLIIPCHKHAHLLSKCIGSIIDQDWKAKEIIVVLDPYDAEAEKILKTFPEVIWTMTDLKENKGAPKARNMGANLATGDYLIFCDADLELYPGALRTYAEAFDEHPECGFVYAGYKFDDNLPFPSQEFDPYFLYINNYIDGNFPIRKEVFEPWREDLKSLQDWELWIRLAKKGVKGHWLKNQYFFTKLYPGKGSISEDSDRNWLERKRTVQNIHNLPRRKVAMTSL